MLVILSPPPPPPPHQYFNTGVFFQFVVLDTCKITNMDGLYAALPQLTSLTVLHTELRQLPPITPELSNLCLRDCNLTYLPDDYFSGSILTAIEITINGLTEVPNLRSIQDTITFIDLSDNLIADTKMLKGHFKALTTLHLSNNLIQSFMMPLPSSWPKLKHISLTNNRIVKFHMPIHYQNIVVFLTANPMRCSDVMTWSEDCQPGEQLMLNCPCQVTLVGIPCYPRTQASTPGLKQDQCSSATNINQFYGMKFAKIYQVLPSCFIITLYKTYDVV